LKRLIKEQSMNSMTSARQTTTDLHPARRRRGLRFWTGRVLLGLVITLLVLCAVGVVYQTIATELDKRIYPAPGQLVDVGGYRLHLYCTGTTIKGSPTVILEQGGGGMALAWFLVQPEVAKTTRVCAYDRAGLGWSEPGPQPRNGQAIARDLHTLLNTADIPGPYVLAGHSYGGLFVRAYAVQYPSDVAGLVLLDAAHADQWTRTPQGQATYKSDSQNYERARYGARLGLFRLVSLPFATPPPALSAQQQAEYRALTDPTQYWDSVEAESRAIGETMALVHDARLGDLPVMVVTAGNNLTNLEGQWAIYQRELAALSTNSAHVVVESADHASLWADPKYAPASAAAILQVVEAIRLGKSLTP
jgi:pimeloyl-ACP methyl ester carboxylesterase